MNTKLLLYISLIALLSSCTKYQYYSVSSTLAQEKNGEFVYENDSLAISYSYVYSGDLHLNIQNKTNQLIYTDWEKSALLKGKNKKAERNNFTYRVSAPEKRIYIPPHSKVSRILGKASVPGYQNLKSGPNTEKIKTDYGSHKRHSYMASDSLNFHQSYLYFCNEAHERFSVVQHQFWVSEILTSYSRLDAVRKNQIAREKLTKFGYVSAFALATGVVWVWLQLEKEAEDSKD
ncbi:MAG: hypothetical protein ACPG4W_06470 [Flavobacteriales bacterium]